VTNFEELKVRQAAVWGSAPFELVAHLGASIHDHLVDRLGACPGERWLDLATGTGAVAFLAARGGADVTGLDFASGMVETATRTASDKGLDVRFEVGDVEQLPFADASFDVLSSAMGMIFAPDHGAVAHEAARVCRPGGRLGFTAWKPGTGFSPVTQRYRPPAPPDAGDSDDWSREEYVRGLLGQAFELEFEETPFRFPPQPGEAMWELITTAIGPIKALAGSLEPEEREQFHQEFVEYVDSFGDGGVPGDYVLVLGRRR
jgi:SAM-dependent methyltransferase